MMTNLEKLIETLQNAPIERTACFIFFNAKYHCKFCKFGEKRFCDDPNKAYCIDGIKKWLESEADDMFENCNNCGLYDDVDIKVMINEQPTADVQEVKHGHWVEKPHIYGKAFCSVCDYELLDNDTPYCAGCGAKMDEEVR